MKILHPACLGRSICVGLWQHEGFRGEACCLLNDACNSSDPSMEGIEAFLVFTGVNFSAQSMLDQGGRVDRQNNLQISVSSSNTRNALGETRF